MDSYSYSTTTIQYSLPLPTKRRPDTEADIRGRLASDVQTTAVSGRLPAKKGENCGNDKFIHKLNLCSKNGKIMQPIAGEPIMERPASRGRMGDRGRLDASDDDDEEVSRAESFHSRRSHTTTGGTGHSRLAYFINTLYHKKYWLITNYSINTLYTYILSCRICKA